MPQFIYVTEPYRGKTFAVNVNHIVAVCPVHNSEKTEVAVGPEEYQQKQPTRSFICTSGLDDGGMSCAETYDEVMLKIERAG